MAATENAKLYKARTSKTQGWKIQYWKKQQKNLG